jgi:D-alanine--D-alanine ligase
MRIGLICGGPSEERGISLNSARSAMDHLTPLGWEVVPFYCDLHRNFYRLSRGQLYSNTPSDFDFKLANTAQPLTQKELIAACRETDIVLPVIHGTLGEDGELQELLEANDIPFVGSSSEACRQMFDKAVANKRLADNGFATIPNCCIEESDAPKARLEKATALFASTKAKKVVVKPSAGGSSIGVATATTPEEAVARAGDIFADKLGPCALIEPYCEGREFSVVVLQNAKNEPVALIPTEIEPLSGDVFTYRHKYLPSRQVEYHCPPRFDFDIIEKIQKSAEGLFTFFKMRDFSRLDGWILNDGRIVFSDVNPISGMEQNSYLFIQGSRAGFTHSDILQYIMTHAAQRYGIDASINPVPKNPKAQKVRILFGGETAERQVSLMSGTNVWLKMLRAADYMPAPYLLAPGHEIWQVPYCFALNHTVEEILARCAAAGENYPAAQSPRPSVARALGFASRCARNAGRNAPHDARRILPRSGKRKSICL